MAGFLEPFDPPRYRAPVNPLGLGQRGDAPTVQLEQHPQLAASGFRVSLDKKAERIISECHAPILARGNNPR